MIFSHITTPIDYLVDSGIPVNHMTAILKTWNPGNDQVLDSFAILLLNLQREYSARMTRRFRKGYWELLAPEDQWFAEAEAAWLEDSIRDIYVATRMYALSKVEPAPDDFDAKAFAQEVNVQSRLSHEQIKRVHAHDMEHGHKNNAFAPDDIARRIAEKAAVDSLISAKTPLSQAEHMLMRIRPDEKTDQFSLYARPNQQEIEYLRTYRDVEGPIIGEMLESLSCFFADIQNASINDNQDKSKKAVPPIILFDDGIPIPRTTSFLGWWQACGVAFRRLNFKEAKAISYWFDNGIPTHIMTYIPPFMPRTHEHMTGGQVTASNAGDADWSLSSRSKYHVRHESGAIDYGHWAARTVVLGHKQGRRVSQLVEMHAFESMDIPRMSFHEMALDTLPHMESTIHQWMVGHYRQTVLLERIRKDRGKRIQTAMIDPATKQQALPYLPIDQEDVITRMASLASNYGLHFRFGDLDSLLHWCVGFEEEAMNFVRSSPAERRQWYMHDAINRVYNIRNPGNYSHFNRKNVHTIFNFTEV